MADTKPLPVLPPEFIARFWSKVQKRGKDECWECAGPPSIKGGNPQIKLNGSFLRMSRVAYFLQQGEDPYPFLVCHKCDNPPCCNGKHLFKGTSLDNNQDCTRKGRRATGDKNGSRLYPERLVRGDRHWTRTNPEKVARGDRSARRMHPESYVNCKGENSFAHQHPETRQGQSNGNSKLTEDQVTFIRLAYEKTPQGKVRLLCQRLAKKFSVKEITIFKAAKGETWKYLSTV